MPRPAAREAPRFIGVADIRRLLRRHGLRLRKGLGQNFLVDNAHLTKIVSAASLEPQDTVLEIGPGLGTLTRHLAQRVRRVVAVEVDLGLAEALTSIVADLPQVKVVRADILSFDLTSPDLGTGYKVVANLPYYITSPVLRHLLESTNKPRLMVLMVQKEVAERIVAHPGEMSLLAVSVQLYGRPEMTAVVPADAFYPRPEVDSAILCIDVYPRPVVEVDTQRYFRVVQAGFSQPRKQLHNAIAPRLGLPPGAASDILRASDIDPARRAQALSLQEWSALCHELMRRGYL